MEASDASLVQVDFSGRLPTLRIEQVLCEHPFLCRQGSKLGPSAVMLAHNSVPQDQLEPGSSILMHHKNLSRGFSGFSAAS